MTARRACELNLRRQRAQAGSKGIPDRETLPGWAQLGFDDLYYSSQNWIWESLRVEGPLNIYDPEASPLLLKWMMEHPKQKIATLFRRDTPKPLWLRAAELAVDLPPSTEKRSALAKLRIILRRFGFSVGPIRARIEPHATLKLSQIRELIAKTLKKYEHVHTVNFFVETATASHSQVPDLSHSWAFSSAVSS